MFLAFVSLPLLKKYPDYQLLSHIQDIQELGRTVFVAVDFKGDLKKHVSESSNFLRVAKTCSRF